MKKPARDTRKMPAIVKYCQVITVRGILLGERERGKRRKDGMVNQMHMNLSEIVCKQP